jgi:hypothetical protein
VHLRRCAAHPVLGTAADGVEDDPVQAPVLQLGVEVRETDGCGLPEGVEQRERLVRPLLVADVVQHAECGGAGAGHDAEMEPAATPANGRQLPAHGATGADLLDEPGGGVSVEHHRGLVGGVVGDHGPSHHLAAGPAGEALRGGVPQRHAAVVVESEDADGEQSAQLCEEVVGHDSSA